MDYKKQLAGFGPAALPEEVLGQAAELSARAGALCSEVPADELREVHKACFGCLDLTSLRSSDTATGIGAWVGRAAALRQTFPGLPNVAAVCVYPAMVEAAGLAIGDGSLRIASVAGGFPSAQTFLEVKLLETAMAVEQGADEVDVVLDLGHFLAGDDEQAGCEIAALREAAGPETTLKVILETGILKTPELIRRASLVAMLAGADFIKTSTGKEFAGATPEAAVVMCRAIGDFYRATGRRVGFKAAGGVATPADAVLYYTIVQEILGPEWLMPMLFRIGASSLADKLLSAIEGREIAYF